MFNVGSIQGYMRLNTTGWNSGVLRVNQSMGNLMRTANRMGMVTIGALTIIEREFGKFDKAIRHATSVSETTQEQFAQMSEMALDASVKWNKAATDTAQAFYYLGSAGLTVTEQMQAFNDTVMLSRAMGSGLDQTVEGLTDIVRAFGLEFANVRNIADQLTKTVVSSNLHFKDLDAALSYVSSTARLTNNTLAETNAMLGVMANAGIKGSMAGTVLRRAMTNLMSPTGEMADLMADMGLRIYDAEGRMRPFIEVMGSISDRLRGVSDAYKNMVFEVLFGRRAIAGQISLFNYGSAALRAYANEIRDASGFTEKVANRQMAAFTEQLGKMWQTVKRAAIELGEKLAPSLQLVSERLRGHLDAFRGYIDANEYTIAATMKWTAVMAAMATVLPILASFALNLTNQFLSLSIAITKAGIAVATSPFLLLAASLYTLRAVLNTVEWKDLWEKTIKPTLDNIWGGVKQTVTQVAWEFSLLPKLIRPAFINVLSDVKSYVEAIAAAAAAAVNPANMPDFINKFNAALKAPFTNPSVFGSEDERARSFQEFKLDMDMWLGTAGDYFDAWKESFIEGGKDLGGILKNQANEDVKSIMGLMDTLSKNMPKELQKMLRDMEKAKNELKNIWLIFTAPPDKFSKAMDKWLKSFGEKLVELKDKWATAAEGPVLYGVQLNQVAEAWNNAIFAFFNPAVDRVVTWGERFTNVLTDISSSWATTMNTFITEGGKLNDFLESMFKNILFSFNKMMSEIAANELLYAIFGNNVGFAFGTTRLKHLATGGESGGRIFDWGGSYNLLDSLPGSSSAYDSLGNTGFSAQKPALGDVQFNVINKGAPVNIRGAGQYRIGNKLIVNAFMDEYNTNPTLRKALGR